ncbi:hypothetical protein FOA52_013872 [Chlamydomonas sp. UWO 241]|nr:hypothetical protein FOA52_013872 [Chlamydomonas sp. UWO 241]
MGRLNAQVTNEDPLRLTRVLDAKHRVIGVDRDALDQQVEEKARAEAAKRAQDRDHADLVKYYVDTMEAQQQAADASRRQNNYDVDAFRQTNQLAHTRKEWDLNRPDAKQIDAPARVGDNDPRLGPSSMQKYTGEDLSAGDRKAAQIEQAQRWWGDAASHKAAMARAEAEETMAHAELVKYQDMVSLDAQAAEASLRRDMNAATFGVNCELAEERRLREAAARGANAAADGFELDATLGSAFMTEDPSAAASALSAYRVRKDHYKGMTEGERAAIERTQLLQMEDNKARAQARAAEEAEYARGQRDIQRTLHEQARQVDDFKTAQLKAAQEVLRRQMSEKAARDAGTSALYKGAVTDAYFGQFGTSHR